MRFSIIASAVLIYVPLATLAQPGKKDPSKYLGQAQPGLTAELFAPGLVTLQDRYEFGSAFSKDGKEFFFATEINDKPEIWMSRLEKGVWTPPEKILTHEKYGYNDPFLSQDGKRLFFISDRALDGKSEKKKDIDIWYVDRTKSGWSDPINAGAGINTDKNEYYISITNKGTLYFSSNGGTTADNAKNHDIRTSEFVNGTFQPSKKLGSAINTENYEGDVYVAPDESYIIYCSERANNKGKGDLYINFKDKNGEWMPSKPMPSVNTEAYEFCPFVTSDGKFLFFTRSGEIYWVSMEIIKEFR